MIRGWCTWTRKRTVESHLRLDVRQLARDGSLDRRGPQTVTWTSGAAVVFQASEAALSLRFTLAGEPRQQTVRLARQAVGFGVRRRRRFACPGCGAAREVLLFVGEGFTCRTCADLAYASQRESRLARLARLVRRARRVRAELGGSLDLREAPPLRPRRMHEATYRRLRAEDERCTRAAREAALAADAGQAERMLERLAA